MAVFMARQAGHSRDEQNREAAPSPRAAQAGITADKKIKAQMATVIANFSAVLRFHMTPSQIEDHVF
jgi:hypothetical protein